MTHLRSHYPLWAALLAAVLLLVAGNARAQTTGAPGPAEIKQIEDIVRDYLMRHPEVLVEALGAYQERRKQQELVAQKQALRDARAVLLSDPASPVGGNRDGDVTVVEFFDYQCPYCKTAAAALHDLLSRDKGVRVVYKELPILGPQSVLGARAALAAARQRPGSYVAFHRGLMEQRGPLSEQIVFDTARRLGLDLDLLRRDMEHPSVAEQITRNLDLSRALGINGTPAFIIGDELVPGAIGREDLARLIAKARGG